MPGLAPPLTTERDLLLAYVAQQRQGVRNAAHGLTDEQARRAPLAGSLSIGGLIKHLADVERSWTDTVLQRDSSSGDDRQSSLRATTSVSGPTRRSPMCSPGTRRSPVRPTRSSPRSPIWTRRCPCPEGVPGSRPTSRHGRCDGSCSTWSRRRLGTPATPTSSERRSTALRCTSSWRRSKVGPTPTGSRRGSQRRSRRRDHVCTDVHRDGDETAARIKPPGGSGMTPTDDGVMPAQLGERRDRAYRRGVRVTGVSAGRHGPTVGVKASLIDDDTDYVDPALAWVEPGQWWSRPTGRRNAAPTLRVVSGTASRARLRVVTTSRLSAPPGNASGRTSSQERERGHSVSVPRDARAAPRGCRSQPIAPRDTSVSYLCRDVSPGPRGSRPS